MFVNKVAMLVHTGVHTFHGSANKNIGEAFLLVWKLPLNTTGTMIHGSNSTTGSLNKTSYSITSNSKNFDSEYSNKHPETQSPGDDNNHNNYNTNHKSPQQQLADNSLAAFLKIIVDVRISKISGILHEYTKHPMLLQAGWKLGMGFGLHVGW